MKRRVLDLLMIVAIAVGGFQVWSSSRERTRLESEYRRLVQETGELPIGDPSKAHLRALETGEPLHFAWRVYLPPKFTVRIRDGHGGSSGTSSSSREFIARVRFREDQDGNLELYKHFAGGSSRGGFGDPGLAKLLRGRWDKVIVEQFGAGDVATIEPDEPVVLLRLSLPKEMEAEARKTLPPHVLRDNVLPTFYELKLGPDSPRSPPKRPGK
jgi:hypothetical protein